MSKIKVTFKHPTNNSTIEINVPEKMLLKDIMKKLIGQMFIEGGIDYGLFLLVKDSARLTAVNKEVRLSAELTIEENGVTDDSTIRIYIKTKGGAAR